MKVSVISLQRLTFFEPGVSEPAYCVEGFAKEFEQELHVWDFTITYKAPGAKSLTNTIWQVVIGQRNYLHAQLREFHGNLEDNYLGAAHFVFEDFTDKC